MIDDRRIPEKGLANNATVECRALKYRGVLHQLACRILGGAEDADNAVQRCLCVASESPLKFDPEGAFRSWLARCLIDEALRILSSKDAVR